MIDRNNRIQVLAAITALGHIFCNDELDENFFIELSEAEDDEVQDLIDRGIPHEDYSMTDPDALWEALETEYDFALDTYNLIHEEVKGGLIKLAMQDKLPSDLHDLDMVQVQSLGFKN